MSFSQNPIVGRKPPSAWKYRGFQIFDFDHPFYPVDPIVLRRFRAEIDPSAIVLWLRHVWRSPAGGDHNFDYHLISYQDPNWEKVGPDTPANPPHPDFRSTMPSLWGRPRHPHGYIEILHSKSKELEKGLSGKIIGAFCPFSIVHLLKYKEITWLNAQAEREGQSQEDIDAKAAAIRAVDAKWQAESDYRWDHDWNHISENMNKLSSEDIRALGAAQAYSGPSIGHNLPSPTGGH